MKRVFDSEWAKAEFFARRAVLWSRISVVFSVIALVALILRIFL